MSIQEFQASWEWKEKEKVANGTVYSLPSLNILSLYVQLTVCYQLIVERRLTGRGGVPCTL